MVSDLKRRIIWDIGQVELEPPREDSVKESPPLGHEPYNPSHDEKGRFAGGGGADAPTTARNARSERAKKSYKPATKEIQQKADQHEVEVARTLKGKRTKDNEPFDVIKGNSAVEVKSIAEGAKAVKITMHPDSLRRKLASANANGYATHTIAFDDRSGKIYYREGVGSFRLSAMKEVSKADLTRLIK